VTNKFVDLRTLHIERVMRTFLRRYFPKAYKVCCLLASSPSPRFCKSKSKTLFRVASLFSRDLCPPTNA
jgi:hypothetical protein